MNRPWPAYLRNETLFSNAIRLRYFIWTILRLADRGQELLEVGFGSGATAVLLADTGYKVTALDVNPELSACFRARYADWLRDDRVRLVQADMFALPWTNRRFDLAYHQGVLEHFPDEKVVLALQEQARVARRVVFDVPNIRYGAQPFGDERLLSVGHWKRLIREGGLTVEAVLGRDYRHWLYVLPHALFTRGGLEKFPWLSRTFGVSSIFVCRSPGKA